MTFTIRPRRLSGAVKAPPSKSDLHRLLIASALSDRPTRITVGDLPPSGDVEATVRCLTALGARIEKDGGVLTVEPVKDPPKIATLRVGESGSTLRFLVPVAAALGVDAEFVMEGRLPSRPMKPLLFELAQHGAAVSRPAADTIRIGGGLTGGDFSVRADVSSQFVSGLLFSMPLIGGGTVNLTGKTESAPYIEMTAGTLRRFGVGCEKKDGAIAVSGAYVSPGECAVEGDWSGAAFWLCAGAVSPKGVTVTGLSERSLQGDRAIVDILRRAGATVTVEDGSVTVSSGELRAFELDATDVPDLVPPAAALGAIAPGETKIRGAARLKMKESDRLAALSRSLGQIGVDITATDDGLTVRGGGKISGGLTDSFSDHRIAMAAAVASLTSSGPVSVMNAEAVSKSYPSFWDDFRALGGRGEEII